MGVLLAVECYESFDAKRLLAERALQFFLIDLFASGSTLLPVELFHILCAAEIPLLLYEPFSYYTLTLLEFDGILAERTSYGLEHHGIHSIFSQVNSNLSQA